MRNYGGEQTAVSEETVLASLATVIKSQRIKALGILATDPLDTAFLIHSFRKSSPDVRIFLRDPDLPALVGPLGRRLFGMGNSKCARLRLH